MRSVKSMFWLVLYLLAFCLWERFCIRLMQAKNIQGYRVFDPISCDWINFLPPKENALLCLCVCCVCACVCMWPPSMALPGSLSIFISSQNAEQTRWVCEAAAVVLESHNSLLGQDKEREREGETGLIHRTVRE